MSTRRVDVFKFEVIDGASKKVFRARAAFHEFGVDYEEFETGPGNYSTAIVEFANGAVEGVPLHLVQFLDWTHE